MTPVSAHGVTSLIKGDPVTSPPSPREQNCIQHQLWKLSTSLGWIDGERNGIRYRTYGGIHYIRTTSVVDIVFPWLGWNSDRAEFGTRCHVWMEAWMNHRPLPSTTPAMDIRLTALVNWFHAQSYRPIATEQTCGSSLGYCGTADLICQFTSTRAYLVDYKFADWREVPHRYYLQLAAYLKLPDFKGLVPRLIQVTAKGDIIVHDLKIEPEHWRIFQKALAIAKWRLSL